jgi:signal transduction histidine kinase
MVTKLLGGGDGSLWIATPNGLSRWKDQQTTNYSVSRTGTDAIMEDAAGKIWFNLGLPEDGTGPLCEVVGTGTQCHGVSDGLPSFTLQSLTKDREGRLWLAGEMTLVRWTLKSQTVYQLPGRNERSRGIWAVASTPDGTIWVGVGRNGPGFGLQRLIDGRWRSFKTDGFDGSAFAVKTLYVDRKGALWVGTYEHGVYRVYGDKADHVDSTKGLSGDGINGFGEDSEGDLWVATDHGVDRFADTPVVSFSVKEGICVAEASSIVASRDGSIWTGGDGALTNLRDTGVSCLRTGAGLPGSQVTSLLEDHSGRLWVGLDSDLWVRENNTFRKISKPDGRPVGFVTGITEDAENNVWIAANGPPRTLMRIQGMAVRDEHIEPKEPRRVAADPTGGIWVGLLNGDIAHFHNGKQETYRFAHDEAALVYQLLPNSDGSVLAATTYGLIGVRDGKRLTLAAKNGLPCDWVSSMTFDIAGNLWLQMDCGLGEIKSADLQNWLKNPDTRISVKTLGVLDGVISGIPAFVGAAHSPDGRLWFVNGESLQMIDPAHVLRNSVPPPVHIEQIIADRKSYPAVTAVRLPRLTRDIEIDYVALSFVAPQKVRFRYRLEGRDAAWQEPGTRRQAFYTDLRPGTHRFRVIACNDEGVWNEEGAALDFVIAPAFYQTAWFQSLCAIAFLALLWGLYRYRLHHIAREFNVRLEERVSERTRLARDLHDTLLQSFQGLMLRFQVVDDLLPEGKAKQQLEHALQRADEAIAEGRSAVYDLRSSTTTTNDLGQAVKALGDELGTQNSAAFRLVVEGSARDLNPIIRDEIYRITREALRNAFNHARAHHIETELTYGERAFRLRIRDDGEGIPPEILKEGRPSHYGLSGMRERAKKAGGKLDIWSGARVGTEIELNIAGSIAYRTPPGGLFRIFRKAVG